MPKRKSENLGFGQIAQYDKILQENIEIALPGLIKKVLKINAVKSEELPDSLQHTKERKPDVLKKITDTKGEVFVLHIEFQTKDEPEMVYRMAEYLVMLARKYKMAVRQFVIFIGEGIPTMADNLVLGKSYFTYQLIAISTINYRVFLRAEKPEEKMFAILADFGNDEPKKVITKIAESIIQGSNGELEKQRRKKQFQILAQLRTLVSENIEIMEHVSSFFKVEKDIFYQVGEKRGYEVGEKNGLINGIKKGRKEESEKKNFEFVKNLLMQTDFTVDKIAVLASVDEAFVLQVKETLK